MTDWRSGCPCPVRELGILIAAHCLNAVGHLLAILDRVDDGQTGPERELTRGHAIRENDATAVAENDVICVALQQLGDNDPAWTTNPGSPRFRIVSVACQWRLSRGTPASERTGSSTDAGSGESVLSGESLWEPRRGPGCVSRDCAVGGDSADPSHQSRR